VLPAEDEDLAPVAREKSLRTKVHEILDSAVPAGDERDETALTALAIRELRLSERDQLTIAPYVQSWRIDREEGYSAPVGGGRHQPILPTQGPPRPTGRGRQTGRPPSARTTRS
jgi:hypothetical protein